MQTVNIICLCDKFDILFFYYIFAKINYYNQIKKKPLQNII
jgi:hypothetical protein